ncbi:SDR family oxidoreductase [Shewanella sp. SNU WT4]|uniref:SDR family oxidoreductase n=1 Tax=Shewanella sp. SNU WT4 TaxID=2590015 RepID=UPI00112981A4|nr:SDR family oxidoreductase [Shewanella sp. SNU WT4]QDF67447.1 SDR family oxidoreductase [Shewanella sp. SNU WT4]
MSNNKVAIIACGWFGLPLAQALTQQGWQVSGTRRSEQGAAQLQELGIAGFVLDLAQTESLVVANKQGLLDADTIIINIPPGLRGGQSSEDYLAQLRSLRQAIIHSGNKRVIFISTTGVYPDADVDETSAPSIEARAQVFVAAEQLFSDFPNACTVRFAGLVGPKRHPGRFFAGKTAVADGHLAVNLVHLDDCIAGVICLLKTPHCSGIYNLCAPEHLNKQTFYQYAAKHLGLTPPEFSTFSAASIKSKRVSGDKICQQLGFRYQHPELRAMLDFC